MNNTQSKLFLALGAIALAPAAGAQAVDTSEWACEYCPFQQGHEGDYEVGAGSVSDDSAYFGNATGHDEEGAYGNLDGDGSYASGAYRMNWTVEDLGLDSRAAELEGSHAGKFDYNVGFRQMPHRQFNTTSSIFLETADSLLLPAGWVRAPTTDGFTALDSSLVSRNIESDRNIYTIGGRYLAGSRFSFSADYRRQETDGTRIQGGSTFTNASLLPMPFDHVTDEVDIEARYGADNSFVALSWYLSDFQNDNTALFWQQPFTGAAGADTLAQAQAPESRFQQLTIASGYALPELRTVMSLSASIGRITQDTAFLPYTTNANLATDPLARPSLDAEVDTTNFALAITSRVVDRGRINFSYRYDERDNSSVQDTWNRVIVDTFPDGGEELNIPYSFERSYLGLSGDYDLFDMLKVSAGYDRKDVDRTFQEVASQSEDTGWGRVRIRPGKGFDIDLRGGASTRDVDNYDEAFAAATGQNPLMRKYHLAYRYREFGDATISWSPAGAPVSVSLTGLFADDEYTRSELGLTDADEISLALDFGWSVSENTSLYFNTGFDMIESTQFGSESFAEPDWRADNEDEFRTTGVGVNFRELGERFDLQLDYMRSEGTSSIDLDSAANPAAQFPDLETTLDYLRVRLGFRQSDRIEWNLYALYQTFETEDWALQGVTPDALPLLLSLGATPYDDEQVIVGLGFRYKMGGKKKEE
ncbi:MAG TPA: MtrB/PioB family decaheme-associated outer membrane protein [Woeseiaceae bacterium]|nr:MtrB/PioB family decaheme-associated outer membrane protein [Woeseiaceae bacterium]